MQLASFLIILSPQRSIIKVSAVNDKLAGTASSKWKGRAAPMEVIRSHWKSNNTATTPGGNLHLNNVILLTGSQFRGKSWHTGAGVCVWHCFSSRQGRIMPVTSTFNLTECFCQQPDHVVAGNYLLCAVFRDRRNASAESWRLSFSLNCLWRAYAHFLSLKKKKKRNPFSWTRYVKFFTRPTDVTLSASPSPLNSSDSCTSAWTFNLEESDSLESVSSEMHQLSVFVRFHKLHF